MIALVWATQAGRRTAERLAAALPEATVHTGPVRDQLERAWHSADQIVAFLATGATVRLVAPLLGDKTVDPGVVCVDEAGRYAVALLGGHAGGANALALRVAEVLGAEPVLTTATDATGVTPMDGFGADLGFRLPDPAPLAKVTAAVLDGAPVEVEGMTWPLPALPSGDPVAGPVRIAVSDRLDATADLVYRPPSLVVGVGASRGAPAEELDDLIGTVLAGAGLAAD